MIPAMRSFTLALRFEVDGSLRHHRQLADRHLFKNAHRSTGGRSGSCFRRIGLRGSSDRGRSDRGRSDRGHDTRNASL